MLNELPSQIPGLEEGTQTQFRVRAQNATGLGEPSVPTPFTTIAPTPEAPKVLGINVRDVSVRAGQEYELKVPFSGFPAPKVLLERNGELIEPGDHIEIRVEDDAVVIHNKSAKRSDTGAYRITLKNPSGQDSTSCNINVLDVPSAPTGPLDISEVLMPIIVFTLKGSAAQSKINLEGG